MNDHAPHVVFDLDDTLYSERDYVHSAFVYLGQLIEQTYALPNVTPDLIELHAAGGRNPIATVWAKHNLPASAMAECIAAMRAHLPNIALRPGTRDLLNDLASASVAWSILTDGRSLTQRQKIAALGLRDTRAIYISAERGVSKPDPLAFEQIMRDFPGPVTSFLYVADNPAKDFVAPNQMGWQTIMLQDDGFNIHEQDGSLPSEMQAQRAIARLTELRIILDIQTSS